jgi:hypothetical protein
MFYCFRLKMLVTLLNYNKMLLFKLFIAGTSRFKLCNWQPIWLYLAFFLGQFLFMIYFVSFFFFFPLSLWSFSFLFIFRRFLSLYFRGNWFALAIICKNSLCPFPFTTKYYLSREGGKNQIFDSLNIQSFPFLFQLLEVTKLFYKLFFAYAFIYLWNGWHHWLRGSISVIGFTYVARSHIYIWIDKNVLLFLIF